MFLSGQKEKFQPTYLESEEYYKQAENSNTLNNINAFSPSEKIPSELGKYLTGYNNEFSNQTNNEYYALNDTQTSQQEFIRESSIYNKKTINGIPLKDYYDNYTKKVLSEGNWFLNKDMPQETRQYQDDSQIQQRMEIYTGLRQERDREQIGVPTRRETNNLFTPAEKITGYGYQYGTSGTSGPGLAITRQKEFEEMKQTIKFKTNEQPFEKIHVGRGLAISSEIPAAGGFQQYTRIVPDNISDYKSNQLPGMVAGGKWLYSNAPTAQQPVVKNRPETFYSICQHIPMPGRSTVTAETIRPDYAVKLKNQNRSVINYGYGVPLNPSLDKFLTT
jgi:hypothetical protein